MKLSFGTGIFYKKAEIYEVMDDGPFNCGVYNKYYAWYGENDDQNITGKTIEELKTYINIYKVIVDKNR